MLEFSIDRYKPCDPENVSAIRPVQGSFVAFGRYDEYQLVMSTEGMNVDAVSTKEIRLNDLILFKMLLSKKKLFDLHFS